MTDTQDPLDNRRRRARYRAMHRGTKEMDWLLGRFADAELAAMEPDELAAFEDLLALPDPDIERWVTKTPEERPDGAIGGLVMRLRRFHGLDTQ